MKKKIKIGLIGCGNICDAYFKNAKRFSGIEITACADLDMARARAKGKEHGAKAMTVKALLASKNIDMVCNLTIPAVHAEVNMQALNAGKHVYTEKPFAVTRQESEQVVALAAKKGLLAGSAPDTFLGAGLQTCRKLVDEGWVGQVVGGAAHMISPGPDTWHPNPDFFYKKGAGPLMDMGPYYITALVNILGPVKALTAMVKITQKERHINEGGNAGKVIKVEVPTYSTAILEFKSGALFNLITTFDCHGGCSQAPLEFFGTGGTMQLPDPNSFGGPVKVRTPHSDGWKEMPLSHCYADNSRSLGMADMASAIATGRAHRASDSLANHVLDIMLSIEDASVSGKRVQLKSTCARPAALPMGLGEGQLD